MEESDNIHNLPAERAAEAAFENEIAKDTKLFLNSLEKTKVEKPRRRTLYLVGLAASVLILMASLITINISHSDSAIAANYNINQMVSRTGENVNDSKFTDAVRSYYEKDYTRAQSLLEEAESSDERVNNYKEWLSLLIALRTSGSNSDTFTSQLEQILSNEDHVFYSQAENMNQDLKLFWRTMVIRK